MPHLNTQNQCLKSIITDFESSNGNYTLFSFNGYVIRFRTSSKLERYTKILEWENGYIAVTEIYKALPEEEEYIDLVPILENLYIDPDEFLKQIEKVRISYD